MMFTNKEKEGIVEIGLGSYHIPKYILSIIESYIRESVKRWIDAKTRNRVP